MLLWAILWTVSSPWALPSLWAERSISNSNEGSGVNIPGGTVWLGSDDREKGFGYVHGGEAAWRWRWFDGEQERQVTLAPYVMDRTLVTQAAYARFVRATGHRVPHISPEGYRKQGFLVHPYRAVRPYLWRDGKPPPDKLDHPVVLVDTRDGAAYCRWRGGFSGDGRSLRGNTTSATRGTAPETAPEVAHETAQTTCGLPSENQWELAARGSDRRYFPWGNDWAPERLNSQARGPYGTTPVDAHPGGRSPFGLFDMAGNVFEWTATAGRPGKSILKGCSWDDQGGICRAAARHDRPSTSRHILIGFRCACIPGKEAP